MGNTFPNVLVGWAICYDVCYYNRVAATGVR